jgi:hypothetical protein
MRSTVTASLLLALAGCASTAMPADPAFRKVEPGKEDSSTEAVFVDMSFDGELVTDWSWSAEQQIEDQLLYTIGQINGDRGVGRLDTVRLSDIESVPEGDHYVIRYHAVLPVAWGRRTNIPQEYTFRLPRDMRSEAMEAFVTAHSHACVDSGAHDVDSGSMWYYYRPNRSGCSIPATSLMTAVADVALSDVNTNGRYPEYDRVWQDGALRVVAIFGKYEDGATTSSDAGIAAYARFVRDTATMLRPNALTTVPARLPTSPGVSTPEITFRASIDATHTIEIVALLVDNVREAGATFDARYAELSTRADLIVYNGHAGLGSNVRALARKGRWTTGQYAIVFMNGCDTFAYVDNALWQAHADVNRDDPNGTRYLDIVMNGMPAFFSQMPRATLAMIRGLMSYTAPRTYQTIFADLDSAQIVLVSGEQDNTFVPGGGGTGPATMWAGLRQSGSLTASQEARVSTPSLAPGRYRFQITGTGDADLYVRVGTAPTTATYDCRPYRSDSAETCDIEVTSATPVHVMVRGYTASSYDLTGSKL